MKQMAAYFQAPLGHFWRWGDGGRVLEDGRGKTICFREELEKYLELFEPGHLPPFLSLVVIIAACKDNYREFELSSGWVDTDEFGKKTPFEYGDNYESDFYSEVWAFLGHVRCLPKEHRRSPGMHHLLHFVFPKERIDKPTPIDLLTYFKNGSLDTLILQPWQGNFYAYSGDLKPLQDCSLDYPTVEKLVLALLTGVQELPTPAEIEISELQPQDEPASDYLNELMQDPRTCGLASLARHIVAALNIPMQARGSNDLPLGGVSDITNRGNFDRLLLSELANDDTTLMARLANNEALFLRREEPPIKIEKERIVLVDTTIKLWGMTRAFAISAALACQERNPIGNTLRAFALGGNRYVDADLSDVEGVVKLMQRLDASLHAAEGLEKCLKSLPTSSQEVILVTSVELLDDMAFARALQELLPQIDYLVTVSRDGKMKLIEIFNGHRRVLSESQFDLRDLLSRLPSKRNKPRKIEEGDLPAFFSEKPLPLLFPANSIRLKPGNTKIFSTNRLLVITENDRALYWQSGQMGGIELFPFIEQGSETDMQLFEENYIVIAVKSSVRSEYKVHLYDLARQMSWVITLQTNNRYLYFHEGNVYYHSAYSSTNPHTEFRCWNCNTGIDLPAPLGALTKPEWAIHQSGQTFIRPSQMKKVINPGYSTLQSVKYVRICQDGELNVEGRSLRMGNDGQFTFEFESAKPSAFNTAVRVEDAFAGIPFPDNPKLRLRRMQWKDGTTGYIDPRGLLHLRSSDPKLPEITIVLLLDAPTAIWASNGDCTGSAYFLGVSNPQRKPAKEFAQKYLQPILQRILSNA